MKTSITVAACACLLCLVVAWLCRPTASPVTRSRGHTFWIDERGSWHVTAGRVTSFSINGHALQRCTQGVVTLAADRWACRR